MLHIHNQIPGQTNAEGHLQNTYVFSFMQLHQVYSVQYFWPLENSKHTYYPHVLDACGIVFCLLQAGPKLLRPGVTSVWGLTVTD